VSTAEVLICCGDLCSPFVMDLLARFPGQIHIVFGNNDADLFRITRKSSERVRVHGEFFETVLDGKKIAVNHFVTWRGPSPNRGCTTLCVTGTTTNSAWRGSSGRWLSIRVRSWVRGFLAAGGRMWFRRLWWWIRRRWRSMRSQCKAALAGD
jgi:hypothetical protein